MKELTKIVDSLGELTEPEMMQQLSDAVEMCPACMLAAIRQSETFKYRPEPDDSPRHHFSFNYKEAHAEYWKEKNAEEREWRGIF